MITLSMTVVITIAVCTMIILERFRDVKYLLPILLLAHEGPEVLPAMEQLP